MNHKADKTNTHNNTTQKQDDRTCIHWRQFADLTKTVFIKFNKCVFKSKQPSLKFMYTKQEPFLSTCILSMINNLDIPFFAYITDFLWINNQSKRLQKTCKSIAKICLPSAENGFLCYIVVIKQI